MGTIACSIRPSLESAAVDDDISATAGSMAALQTRGGTFGQALEKTATAPRDFEGAQSQGRAGS